jgi:hypothetical protein
MKRVKLLSSLKDADLFTLLELDKQFWLLPESFISSSSSNLHKKNTNDTNNTNNTNNTTTTSNNNNNNNTDNTDNTDNNDYNNANKMMASLTINSSSPKDDNHKEKAALSSLQYQSQSHKMSMSYSEIELLSLSSSKTHYRKSGMKPLSPPYFEAIRSFREIAQQYSPASKILILKQAVKAIYSAVEIFWSNQRKIEYRLFVILFSLFM